MFIPERQTMKDDNMSNEPKPKKSDAILALIIMLPGAIIGIIVVATIASSCQGPT